jgi:hypothetical protein
MHEARCAGKADEPAPKGRGTGGPLLAATVRFSPAFGGSGSGANSLIPSQGRGRIIAPLAKKGLAVGDHRASVPTQFILWILCALAHRIIDQVPDGRGICLSR